MDWIDLAQDQKWQLIGGSAAVFVRLWKYQKQMEFLMLCMTRQVSTNMADDDRRDESRQDVELELEGKHPNGEETVQTKPKVQFDVACSGNENGNEGSK
jgi:hypothetical protein